MVRAALILTFFGLWLGCPEAGTADESIRLSVSGPLVPYEVVEYAIEVAHGTIIARYSVKASAGFGEQSRIGLVTQPEWNAILTRLRALKAVEIQSQSQPDFGVKYTFEWKVGPERKSWTIDNPSEGAAKRASEIIAMIRRFVRERAGDIPFWDGRLLDSEAGQLRVRSEPPALIVVDGLSLNRLTPVVGLDLLSGSHKIDLIHPKNGSKWSYPITIKAGRTTVLNVRLK